MAHFFPIACMVMNLDCDHPTLVALISADSPKVKITTLSRGAQYRKIFRQISYLDHVIEDYLWCTICKKLLANRSSNLIRHWRTHDFSKSKVNQYTTRSRHKVRHGTNERDGHKVRHGTKSRDGHKSCHGHKSRRVAKQGHQHRQARVHPINF